MHLNVISKKIVKSDVKKIILLSSIISPGGHFGYLIEPTEPMEKITPGFLYQMWFHSIKWYLIRILSTFSNFRPIKSHRGHLGCMAQFGSVVLEKKIKM
jgi:hypothetical protein